VRVDETDPPELRIKLAGLSEAASPEGDTELDTATVPAKPYRLPRLIVEVADEPDENVTEVWLAERVKSGGGVTVTMTLVVCENEPLVAVTTTGYVPGVEDDTVSTDVAVPPAASTALVGLRDADRPASGETEKATPPLNRLMLVTVIVDVADEPDANVRLAGLGDTRKSFALLTMLQLSLNVPTTGTNWA